MNKKRCGHKRDMFMNNDLWSTRFSVVRDILHASLILETASKKAGEE
jgi:hypothetical protein